MGLVTLKRSQRAPSLLSCHSKKTAIYEPGNRASPDMESTGTLTLDFPASGTVTNKFLVLGHLAVPVGGACDSFVFEPHVSCRDYLKIKFLIFGVYTPLNLWYFVKVA